MKLVCDCGNEGMIVENGTIDGKVTEGYIDGDKFDTNTRIIHHDRNVASVLCKCKKCGKKIYF